MTRRGKNPNPFSGFKIFQDQIGKWRCYHRATGHVIDLEKFPRGSDALVLECARVRLLYSKKDVEPKPGTLGMLIERYRSHRDFKDKAPRTRKDYQRCFDYLKPIQDEPLTRFTRPFIVKIRDKAGEDIGRKWGSYVKTVLSVVFAWGVDRGYVKENPAFRLKNIPKPRDAPHANRPWTDAEREAVQAALPPQLRVPIALMMYCGLDPSDALKLPRSAIQDGKLDTRRNKTGVPVWIPLPAPLLDVLAKAPKHDAITVCANSYGKPWTYDGFSSSWKKVRKKLQVAGLVEPGLTPKGLRHTVANILSEIGYDERTIADMLGQNTIEMARHYARRADKSRKMAAVVENFEAEVNRRRTKVSKPAD